MRAILLALLVVATPLVGAAALPSARCCMGAFTDASGQIHLVGGRTDSWSILADVERFDPSTDSFTPVASISGGRHGPAIAWTGSVAYVIGGHDASWDVATILAYDPAAASVTTKAATLPEPRRGMSAVWDPRALPDIGCPSGCVYAFGGIHEGRGIREEELRIFRYDPTSDTIAAKRARFGSFADAGPGLYYNGTIHVLGASGAIHHYDPVADTLTLSPFRLPRSGTGAALAFDGEYAILVGGLAPNGTDSSQPIRYFPAEGRADYLPVWMSTIHGAAAAISAGRVYVFGGLDEQWNTRSTVESFDATGRWIVYHPDNHTRPTPQPTWRPEPTWERPAPHPVTPPHPHPAPPPTQPHPERPPWSESPEAYPRPIVMQPTVVDHPVPMSRGFGIFGLIHWFLYFMTQLG